MMEYLSFYESPIGRITMASDGTALTGLWFDGQKYDRAGLSACEEREDLMIFQETCHWLDLYFQGKDPGFIPKLSIQGSPFRQLVAEIMCTIPYGTTMTYGRIASIAAERMGREHMSAQAVGGAVGHNRISIIIPCHRVMGTDGSLTGYAGGIERKLYLLNLEHIKVRTK